MTFDEYKNLVKSILNSDYARLLNAGRKWKKIDTERAFDVRIGVIGSASLQLTVSVLKALLCKYDIYADIYEGEYNGISMDVLDENSHLYKFNPSYVIVIPDYRDIQGQRPKVLSDAETVEQKVQSVAQQYMGICEKINNNIPGCQILLSNFVEPIEGPLGNLEANYLYSESQFYKLVNIELIKQKKSYVTIIDIEKLAAYIGKSKWFDESAYFLSKLGFALENIGYFCDSFARQFVAFLGRPKKCLVLDLDNTLWGGVVGDLGYDGVMLDSNDAVGESFLNFQRYILELRERGVILAVCSKNDFENAKEPFDKNENMLLKLSDISSFIANWNDKASNIRSIASELNIGIDSLVFFDDNPTERELVREFLPEVTVVDVPEDPALYVRALNQAFCFEWNQITSEDISRVQSYSDNHERTELLVSCNNYDNFLEKLEMQISCESLTELTLSRFSQLTNKSNQFNLCTQRYSEAEIDGMRRNDEFELYTVSLKDRFSNYGIIACVVLRYEDSRCLVENWVMSCRVLKKTVENYTIQKIVEKAKCRGANQINAKFIQTKKNGMVRDLYEALGFKLIQEDEIQKDYVLDESQIKTYKQKFIMKEFNNGHY